MFPILKEKKIQNDANIKTEVSKLMDEKRFGEIFHRIKSPIKMFNNRFQRSYNNNRTENISSDLREIEISKENRSNTVNEKNISNVYLYTYLAILKNNDFFRLSLNSVRYIQPL